MKAFTLIIIGLILAGLALPSHARGYCPEPRLPSCAKQTYTFDDQARISRCQNDLNRFSTEVNRYAACLKEQVSEKYDELSEATEEFNCRAGGGKFC